MWGALSSAGAPPRRGRKLLAATLVGAFVLRLGVAWVFPSIHQADEIYQVTEQANRAVNGYGIVSWEFQTRSRAAILPVIVEPIFRLHLSVQACQMLVAGLFAALSLIPVWVAFQWAWRLFGAGGAFAASFVMATWFELVFFSPKPTVDAVGGYLFLGALFLGGPRARAASSALAGLCLMLALGVRVQLAPAVAVALIALAIANGRRGCVALAAGAAAGLFVVGAIEWSWWGVPFQGQWGYLAMEFRHGASTFFAREPATFFLKNYVLMYGGFLPIVAILAAIGASRAPILGVVFVALALPFHFVGHKEYRFMIDAAPVLLLMVGLGAAQFWIRVQPAWRVVGVVAWLVSMTAMSFSDSFRPFWTQDRNHIVAFREIGRQPDACGIVLASMRWWHTPGYSGIGRNIPLNAIDDPAESGRLLQAATYWIAGTKAPPPPAPWVRWREYSRPVEYAYRRPGMCVPDAAARIERPPTIPGLVP
jgi:hypothetical protein